MQTLIVYANNHGYTQTLAEAIAEGARAVPGNDVVLQSADETEPTDLEQADAIIWGSPSYFGLPSASLKALLDGLGEQWFGSKLVNKVGGAFCTTSATHGGLEECIRSLQIPMFHLGMVVVGAAEPYSPDAARYGVPYGAGAAIAAEQGQGGSLSRSELDRGRAYGQRVANIAAQLVREAALR
jgi:NAD(P)H dehydrogenase (quinone)